MRAPKDGTRHNVKSGCRTCKLRKVKCDEGKPSCRRCVSTGRVCDGYGIWGGGGNRYQHRSSCIQHSNPDPVANCRTPSPLGAMTARESLVFEYFVVQCAPKLPSAFASPFWNTLVFQASADEGSVLCAVLALSSAHRHTSTQKLQVSDRPPGIADEDESFILQQYSKAINHLQTHMSAGSSASVRVTLVTCLLFICLELLRGRYQSAISHLRSGLKLLSVSDCSPGFRSMSDLTMNSHSFEEHWIAVTFGRLYVSTALMGQISLDLYPTSYIIEFPTKFSSVMQARHCLDQLLAKVTSLVAKASVKDISSLRTRSKAPKHAQSQLKLEFLHWKEIHARSKNNIETSSSFLELWAYELLEKYYIMGLIMADTCMNEAGELAFDSHMCQFALIIESIIPKFKLATSSMAGKGIPGHGKATSKSVCDLGAIPPLYYVALKCRDHRIRLQAIKLLKLLSHSEGIWHAHVAASVAEEVMRIEEAEFYKTIKPDNSFSPYTLPVVQDTSFPTIPLSNRICQVQIILPNDASEPLIIECLLERDSHLPVLVKREYNPNNRSWRTI